MKDEKFLEIINPEKKFLIIASRPLDFDCLGSGLILKKYLESLGKQVTLIWPAKMKQEEKNFFSFLPYFEEVIDKDTREILKQKNFDILIFVDGSNLIQFYDTSKTEDNRPNIEIYDTRIHIDHHQESPEKLGTYKIHDVGASAAAELILDQIIPESFIDQKIAALAYAAIVWDTGNFQWNFTTRTLGLASLLASRGAVPMEIINKVFPARSKQQLQMLDFAIANLDYRDNLKTLFLFMPYEKLQEANIDETKLDDLKRVFNDSISGKIQGYDRGIIVYEPTPNWINISARGNNLGNRINMPKMLMGMGENGGGHFNACGAELKGNFEEVKERLINLMGRYLEDEKVNESVKNLPQTQSPGV